MKTRTIAIAAVALWGITIALVGWLMMRDWTRATADHRREIPLSAQERELVLVEMRGVLRSVNGVLTGLAENDMKKVEDSARASGMVMAADENAGLIAKLPPEFKEMGLGLHRGFDSLADAAKAGTKPDDVLKRITELTSRCNSCHDVYRLSDVKQQSAWLGPDGLDKSPSPGALAVAQ